MPVTPPCPTLVHPSRRRPRAATGGDFAVPMDLALPATFVAFYALHHDRYLAYAQAHMHPAAAKTTLRETFGELATHWSDILCRPNPAAHAWDRLVRRIRPRVGTIDTSSSLQYQVIILHRAGCSVTGIADSTGQDPNTIRYLLHVWTRDNP
ncbi:hypothetical protein [Streptomyces sp. AK02-01A]|uniref:hypothetical protein n=1 Tax=Streptomyces sp. AK02-01A TaxID=3028648 RepID=UPI0029B4172F|nr:hypothetical protein [Streptomyces sp. AK02-01A]MDX3854009.1 hypothetical protein [Streptomyces sp. AK02-01A]